MVDHKAISKILGSEIVDPDEKISGAIQRLADFKRELRRNELADFIAALVEILIEIRSNDASSVKVVESFVAWVHATSTCEWEHPRERHLLGLLEETLSPWVVAMEPLGKK